MLHYFKSSVVLFLCLTFVSCSDSGDSKTDSDTTLDTSTTTHSDTNSSVDSSTTTDTAYNAMGDTGTNAMDTETAIDTGADSAISSDTGQATESDLDTMTSTAVDTETAFDTESTLNSTDSTEDSNGPPEVTCDETVAVAPGSNHGDYSLFAIRVDEALAPGQYSVRVRNGSDGIAWIFEGDTLIAGFTYDPHSSLEDATQQTIVVDGFFELDLRSQEHGDLSYLEQSIFDGCHYISVTEDTPIVVGETYGGFRVEAVSTDADLTSGTYSFFVESGNTGVVALRRDGVSVEMLSYDWQSTMGPDITYTFEFLTGMTLTVTRPVGSSNLFPLAAGLFNGRHIFVVQ